MVAKIKNILFSALKSISSLLRNTKLHRIIPFRREIYDFFFRKFWLGGEILEIQGSKMYINVKEKDPNMRKTFQAYASGLIHEETTTNLFKKTIKKGDTIVDLGANIGYFTLLAAKLTGREGKVYSFEPEPKNYNYLLKNIKLNNYDNVLAIQKAVSDKNGKTKLYICEHDTGHHTINQYGGIENYKPNTNNKENFIEIDTIILDDFLRNKEKLVDVIKMDIEGAEMLALSGMGETIKRNKNLRMFVEFFPLLIRKMGSSPEEFIRKILEDYGFSIFVIGEDYNARNKELLIINKVDELMALCKNKNDHLNLFISNEIAYHYKEFQVI